MYTVKTQSDFWEKVPGLPQIRKWSGEKTILQGQGIVKEFYLESGKIKIIESIELFEVTVISKLFELDEERKFLSAEGKVREF